MIFLPMFRFPLFISTLISYAPEYSSSLTDAYLMNILKQLVVAKEGKARQSERVVALQVSPSRPPLRRYEEDGESAY